MRMVPLVQSARNVGAVPLGPGRVALLYDEITASGAVDYAALVAVVAEGTGEPLGFVTSEVNALVAEFGGGTHYLGIFDASGHANLGSSDAWGDPQCFFAEALRLAVERFGSVTGLEQSEPT